MIFNIRTATIQLVCLCLLTPLAASAQVSVYDSLLARVKARDSSVDFGALRLVFAGTSAYNPYGSRDKELRTAIYAALDATDPGTALRLADSLTSVTYVDLEAHMAATLAAEALGDTATAGYHGWVTNRLLASIDASGQGTQARPFVVISVAEEYAYALLVGLRRKGAQGLGRCGGRPCDWVEFESRRTGRDTTLYFDVSLPTAWLDSRLRP